SEPTRRGGNMGWRTRLMGLALLLSAGLQGQELPRTDSGRPDLSGIWQVRNQAAVNILSHVARFEEPAGHGIVVGDSLPYRDEARARQTELYAARAELDPL